MVGEIGKESLGISILLWVQIKCPPVCETLYAQMVAEPVEPRQGQPSRSSWGLPCIFKICVAIQPEVSPRTLIRSGSTPLWYRILHSDVQAV